MRAKGSHLYQSLDAMEIADNLCRQNGNPPGLFLALQPTPVLRNVLNKLYEPHAKELVRRCLAGESVEPATDAEILAALSATSLHAPLRSESVMLFEHLFKTVTGEPLEEEFGRESYPGQLEELLADARRKLAVPGARQR